MNKTSVFLLLLLSSANILAMTLEDYLQSVGKKHRLILSTQEALSAAQDRKALAESELSTLLTAKVSSLVDKNPVAMGTYTTLETNAKEYSLGLAKKFSSGTQASVTGQLKDVSVSATSSGTPVSVNNGIGSYQVLLSQSLWKDFLGWATRTKVQRLQTSSQIEITSQDLQLRQLFTEAETLFWDYLYAQEELRIRRESLERARRIEGWVKRRAENGIGDRADVLNAQGLVASRELQKLVAEDEMYAMNKKMFDMLELSGSEKIPELKGRITEKRSIENLVGVKSLNTEDVVRVDAYLNVLEAETKKMSATEAADSVRPDLQFEFSYKPNNYETTASQAMNHMFDSSNPTTAVALKLSWMLDSEVRNASRNSAQKDALAAQFKKERKLLESRTAWEELIRRHSEMSKKIELALQLSRVQLQKAAVERDKLSKGRSVTSQVIQAEQDAAEAELTLSQLQVQQRKMEAQSRMFMPMQGSL